MASRVETSSQEAKAVRISDEFFAKAENLINPKEPIVDKGRFVPTGAWYDGWETRRHNEEECDWCILRFGQGLGVLAAFELDTSHFNGNEAPAVTVHGLKTGEQRDIGRLLDDPGSMISAQDERWQLILPMQSLGPNQKHFFILDSISAPYSHLKLSQYPDGGIARFRAYGNVRPRPESMKGPGPIDVASVGFGGLAVSSSDEHYGNASNLLLPGRGHDMSDGWETKRSRQPGHTDWVIVKLGAPAIIREVVVDTAFYLGNPPKTVNIEATVSNFPVPESGASWTELVRGLRTPAGVETVCQSAVSTTPYTHVRMTIVPDGGVKRLRVLGLVQGSALAEDCKKSGHLTIATIPITSENFAAYGQCSTISKLSEGQGDPANQGTARKLCQPIDFVNSFQDHASLKLYTFDCRPPPGLGDTLRMRLLERHPSSTQLFLPTSTSFEARAAGYLVVVALPGHDGKPDLRTLKSFSVEATQCISYGAGIWHAPMIVKKAMTFASLVHESGINSLDCREEIVEDVVVQVEGGTPDK